MRQDPAGMRLRAHFVLNEAQRVVSAFCRAASSTNVKSAATEAVIPKSLFQVALTTAASFRASVMSLFSQDLSIKSLPVTYLHEFPALSAKRGSDQPSMGTPVAKRGKCNTNTDHNLPEEQCLSSRACGFVIAHGTLDENREYSKRWPWSFKHGICVFHSIRGFSCRHGVSGDEDGTCACKHLSWSSLTQTAQAKIRNFVDDSNGLMTLANV